MKYGVPMVGENKKSQVRIKLNDAVLSGNSSQSVQIGFVKIEDIKRVKIEVVAIYASFNSAHSSKSIAINQKIAINGTTLSIPAQFTSWGHDAGSSGRLYCSYNVYYYPE